MFHYIVDIYLKELDRQVSWSVCEEKQNDEILFNSVLVLEKEFLFELHIIRSV